jgi:hypothetical protein
MASVRAEIWIGPYAVASSTVDNPYAQPQHMTYYTQMEHIAVYLSIIDVRSTECARGDNGGMRRRDIAFIGSRNLCLSMERIRAMGEVRRAAGGDQAAAPARRAVERMLAL